MERLDGLLLRDSTRLKDPAAVISPGTAERPGRSGAGSPRFAGHADHQPELGGADDEQLDTLELLKGAESVALGRVTELQGQCNETLSIFGWVGGAGGPLQPW